MSNDLKKRLRRRWPNEDPKTQAEKREAAERIEELEAKLATCEKYRDAYAEMGRIGTEAYRELEAKLAKVVGQMQRVKDYRYDPNIGIELNRLEEALAELKEEDRG